MEGFRPVVLGSREVTQCYKGGEQKLQQPH